MCVLHILLQCIIKQQVTSRHATKTHKVLRVISPVIGLLLLPQCYSFTHAVCEVIIHPQRSGTTFCKWARPVAFYCRHAGLEALPTQSRLGCLCSCVISVCDITEITRISYNVSLHPACVSCMSTLPTEPHSVLQTACSFGAWIHKRARLVHLCSIFVRLHDIGRQHAEGRSQF